MVNVAKFFALLFFVSNIFGIEFDDNTFVLTLSNYMLTNQIKLSDTIINYESSTLHGLKPLSNALMYLDVDTIINIPKDTTIDCLSMFLHHNFYVSEDKIFAQDVFPAILAVASFTVSWNTDGVVETSIALFNVRM